MRAIAFVRSLLIVLVVGAVCAGCAGCHEPVAVRRRFTAARDAWPQSIGRSGGLRALFAEPLTDRALADVAIRIALLVAWSAVLVFVVTVVAETAHMLRHGGHHLPDVRGLRWSQRGARAIAAGLVALLPVLTHARRVRRRRWCRFVVARPAGGCCARGTDARSIDSATAAPIVASSPAIIPPAGEYVVRAGDSVFGIAHQLAGPDEHAVATYAERILDLNLGREMSGGDRFTNPGLIDVGWVLQLPPADAAPSGAAASSASGTRWCRASRCGRSPTTSSATRRSGRSCSTPIAGRTFDDGRMLVDPALLRPGWDLVVPVEASDEIAAGAPAVTGEQERPDPVPAPVVVDHDAHHVDAATVPEIEVVSRRRDRRQPASTEAPMQLGPRTCGPRRRCRRTERTALGRRDRRRRRAPQLLTIRRGGDARRRRADARSPCAAVAVCERRRRVPRLPEPAARVESIERELRNIVAGERVARVDLAIRAATLPLVESGQRLLAALAARRRIDRDRRHRSGGAAGDVAWRRRSMDAAGLGPARDDRRRCQAGERAVPCARPTRGRRPRARRLRRPRGARRVGGRRVSHAAGCDRRRDRGHARRLRPGGGDDARLGRCSRRRLPRASPAHDGSRRGGSV